VAGLGHPGEVGGGVDGLGERTVRKKEKAERGESDMGGRERGNAECGGLFGILVPRWQATSALVAYLVHLRPGMDPY